MPVDRHPRDAILTDVATELVSEACNRQEPV